MLRQEFAARAARARARRADPREPGGRTAADALGRRAPAMSATDAPHRRRLRRPRASRRRPGCSPTGSPRPRSAPSASAASRRRGRGRRAARPRPRPGQQPAHRVPEPAALRAAIDAVASGRRPDRGHADLQRLLQRAVQDVLRRPRAGRAGRQAGADRGDRRHGAALAGARARDAAAVRLPAGRPVVPTAVFAASEDWGTAGSSDHASPRASSGRARSSPLRRRRGSAAARSTPSPTRCPSRTSSPPSPWAQNAAVLGPERGGLAPRSTPGEEGTFDTGRGRALR